MNVPEEEPGEINFEISVNGKALDSIIKIISIQIKQEVNSISSATIRILNDGNIALPKEFFSNSEEENFIPGNEIEIRMGHGSKRKPIFKGVVVSQRMLMKKSTSYLQISCKDKSFLLTKSRSNIILESTSDDQIFSAMANKAGVAIEYLGEQKLYSSLVQHNATDWDYLVIRSEANDLFVVTDNNKIVIKKFDFDEPVVAKLPIDKVALSVDLNLNGEELYSELIVNAWDSNTQEVVQVEAGLSEDEGQGNISASKIASMLKMPAMNKFAAAELDQSEMDIFSKSWITRMNLSKIQGEVAVKGTLKVKVGEFIELSGFSNRFNGKAFISRIRNVVKKGRWTTTLSLGMSSRRHSTQNGCEENKAIGLLPPAVGIQIGKVLRTDGDPSGSFRVEVQLPTSPNPDHNNSIWARIAFPYASAEVGFFFFPEIGDEVLVNFLGNDPRFPVIIGSLYSSARVPNHNPSENNEIKSIVSRSGVSIIFDDDNQNLTAKTPNGHSMVLSDDNQSITLKDSNGNEFILDQGGVKISSINDITLDARGSISIKAESGDLKGEGINVEMIGVANFRGEGGGEASLKSSGQTIVRGSIVQIN